MPDPALPPNWSPQHRSGPSCRANYRVRRTRSIHIGAMRWTMIALVVFVGCAAAALGVLVAADVRLATRPDPAALMVMERGRG